jgi:hypothetical protein
MRVDPREQEPDPLLVDAARAGRLYLSDLADHERRFVVGALTSRGESADLIADRLHCGKRVIQRIRAQNRSTT